MPSTSVPLWGWALLLIILIACVAIDLIAHRGHDRADSRSRAVLWSAIWIGGALAFGVFVWVRFGAQAGEEFLAAYLLEKSLSIDNLFLFLVVFSALSIPIEEQHRVLTFGIIGALVFRCVFILLGASAMQQWHEVTYAFGVLLIATALKLLLPREGTPTRPRVLDWLERHLPWTRRRSGHAFFLRDNGRLVATPLFVALVGIELADIVFALDSIPAAFAVSNDTFILYSSNIFALLGLRALYIVLARSLAGLRYLRFGLVGVLALAGVKMLASNWIQIPPAISVATIVGVIGSSVIASVISRRGTWARD